MSKDMQVVPAMPAEDFAKMMQSVMLSAIEAARTPVLTEQQKKQIEYQQQERIEGAEREKQRRENTKRMRRTCMHKRKDGTCAAVFVKGCGDPNLQDGTGSGNFFICQRCQAIIRPGTEPKNYGGMDIFDNTVFERLWQEAGSADMIG